MHRSRSLWFEFRHRRSPSHRHQQQEAQHDPTDPIKMDEKMAKTQTFDDERTSAGIRTLAAAGEKFQTILFTHQMSLVDAAKKELGEGLDLLLLESA